MKTRLLYHGTSADNLASILANGFDATGKPQIWEVSEERNYFWCRETWLEHNDRTEDDTESQLHALKEAAAYAAECGLTKAKDCRRVVFELEIPEGEAAVMFMPDDSCPNMEGAVVTMDNVPASYIKRYWIDKDDLGFFRAYFGSIMHGRELAAELQLTDAEELMVKAIQKNSDGNYMIMEALSEMINEMEEHTRYDNKD